MIHESAGMVGMMLLAIAAVGWYIASQMAADALSGQSHSPGRRAFGFSIPGFTFVIASVIAGKPQVAVGAIFASCVACLTLVLGIITLSASDTRPTLPRRVWGFILPVSLIALLIGFRGGIDWISAAILALEGLAILLLWNDRSEVNGESKAVEAGHIAKRAAVFIVAAIAACVASWAGVAAAGEISNRLGLGGGGLVTALILAPAMVLSLIGAGSTDAHEARYDQFVSALIGFVMIHLCLLLPLTTVAWLARPHVMAAMQPSTPPATAPSTLPTTLPALEPAVSQMLPYPMSVWRVDTLLLIAAGLLLLPVAQGRWTLGKSEGLGLLLAYLIYFALTAAMAR